MIVVLKWLFLVCTALFCTSSCATSKNIGCSAYCRFLPQLDFQSEISFIQLRIEGFNQHNEYTTWQAAFASPVSRYRLEGWWWNVLTNQVQISISTADGRTRRCSWGASSDLVWVDPVTALGFKDWLTIIMPRNEICHVILDDR